MTLGGRPVRLELTSLDLGEITLGRGLLFEREWMEGVLARGTWGSLSLEFLGGGQTWLLGDDLLTGTLRWGPVVGPGLGLTWLSWRQTGTGPLRHYLSLAGDLPGLGRHLRLAGEVAWRLPQDGASGVFSGLLRADAQLVGYGGGPFQVHLGYQLRHYRRDLIARADAEAQVAVFQPLPWFDDGYVTHPTVFGAHTDLGHQWVHTLMFEGRLALGRHFALQAEVEGWHWSFHEVPLGRLALTPSVEPASVGKALLPDTRIEVFYRLWLALHPFSGQPWRLRVGVANVAPTFGQPATPVRLERFDPLPVMDLEVPL